MKKKRKELMPITYEENGMIVRVSSTNLPSPEAIRNTNQKINEVMNEYYSKLDKKQSDNT